MTRKLGASLIGALFLSLGCGGNDAVKKMEEMAEKVCACKDMDCMQKVQKEAEEWAKTQPKEEPKVSDEEKKKVEAATKKMTECAMKLATGGAAK